MTGKFDLIVIGTGSAASTVAHECRSAGWEVAIVDSRPFGGMCAHQHLLGITSANEGRPKN